jgi:UDP-3-O-[3-hydroxymyristoyl] N-acetylglucosamine deacetylase
MDAIRNQHTIGGSATVTGFGYWTGEDVGVEFRPAAPDAGIVFVRRDLPGCPRIPARVESRIEGPRRTSLHVGEAAVDMVEHILAAFYGLHIDNCEVWVDRPEMPGCDGSSRLFVEALDGAGVAVQPARRATYVVRRAIRLGDDAGWIEARPIAGSTPVFCYRLDYGALSPIPARQFQTALTPETFRADIAPARTFMLKSEADRLLAQGLGRRATAADLLVFGPDGPLGNRLHFDDECARHKTLDMIGDFALAGVDLVGRFTAYRSGHRLNAELVREILADTDPAAARRCA